jgi:hypothetical protein
MTQWGLDTLFNPAKRHMDEEKRRLQSTREEFGDSSGGKRIDLESGKVTIQRATSAEDDAEGAAGDDEQPANGTATAAKRKTPNGKANGKAGHGKTAKGDDKSALTPAQIRAAERRGRQAR